MGDMEKSINWIDVKERVPHNRRNVLAWGDRSALRKYKFGVFLGPTKCNVTSDGAKFDVEKKCWPDVFTRVTHWAEITGPDGEESQ